MPDNCPRCGWKYGFHICVDLTKRVSGEGMLTAPKRQGNRYEQTERHRVNIANSQRDRWAKIREQNRPRDEKLIARYAEGGIGTPGLAKEFGISRVTVLKILKRAESEGLITIRKPGYTIAKGAP